jgi:hypothetical protein
MKLPIFSLLVTTAIIASPLSGVYASTEGEKSSYKTMPYSELQAAHAQSPNDLKIANAYARRSVDWGKYNTAVDVYKNLLNSSDEKVLAKQNKVRLDLAKLYLSVDDFVAAREVLEQADINSASKKDAKKIKKMLKKIDKKTNPHKFGGSVGVAFSAQTNIAKALGGAKSFDEIEEDEYDSDEDDMDSDDDAMDDIDDDFDDDMGDDDFGDDFGDDDFLDDLEDDIETDDEDLDSQDSEDSDGDGIDDDVDEDVVDLDPDGDGIDNDLDNDGVVDDADGDGVIDEGGDGVDGAGDGDAGDGAGDGEAALSSGSFARKKATPNDSDERFDTKAGLKYGYMFSPRGHSWNSGFNIAAATHRDRDDLDRYNFIVGTGPVFNIPSLRLKVSPTINYLRLNKDGDDVFESWIPSLSVGFKASPTLSFAARYNFEARDFEDEDAPDVDVDTLKLAMKYKLTKKDQIGLSFSPKVEDNTNATKDKDQYGYGIDYTHAFPHKIFATARAAYKNTKTENSRPVKEDDEYTYGLVVGKKFDNNMSVFMGANGKEKDSNIKGKDSFNKSFIVGTGWKF